MATKAAAGNADATNEAQTVEVERLINWQSVTNWGTYLEQAQLTQSDILQAAEVLGDGFTVYSGPDRERLVNVPMLIVDWNFFDSDYGDGGQAVYVRAITRDGKKVAFTDGSKGVCAKLAQFTQTSGKNVGPIICNGLTKREFDVDTPDGKTVHVVLFDIDNRPYQP